MTLSDSLIVLREELLNQMTGNDARRTLNPSTDSSGLTDGAPAADLRRALQSVLSVSLDVSAQRVDYGILRGSAGFAAYCERAGSLQTFDPSSLSSREARLAFWINLYNAMVIHSVIELDVKRSVAGRLAGLDFFRKAAYSIGGQRVSCDDIEHGILRLNRGHPFLPGPQFASSDPRRAWIIEPMDARIHFALNCASRSCPPIRVYTAEALETQLDMATRSYIASDVMIAPEENAIHLSSIFKWFSSDFGGRDGIIDFLLSYLPDEAEHSWLSGNRGNAVLRYEPYDWRLNSKLIEL